LFFRRKRKEEKEADVQKRGGLVVKENLGKMGHFLRQCFYFPFPSRGRDGWEGK